MNKTCARCQKVVYPIEELKCLDKVWHKACFKCRECGMTLNMRTYKGFEKQPYCEAHIPKAKATTMAETPELRRIAENTKIQSNAVYHAEFERAKGKCTQVADDPETLRIKKNTNIISNASYHGDQHKKAVMEQKRALEGEPQVPEPVVLPPMKQPIGIEQRDSPYSARQSSTVIYTSDRGPVSSSPQRRVGSIADLDPLSREYGSMAPPPAPPASSGRVCRALYDYEAQDGDEVSFRDGDLLLNCSPVDEGWMTGVVERTGRSGMLPANYVQALH